MQNLQAGIFETEGRPGVAARHYELRCCLSALTTQEEDAAVVESPAGVTPPLLVQLVRLLSPAPSRCEDLTQALSLEASTRQKAVLGVKLLRVVHGGEGAASVEVRHEDLGSGEAGAKIAGFVETSG